MDSWVVTELIDPTGGHICLMWKRAFHDLCCGISKERLEKKKEFCHF